MKSKKAILGIILSMYLLSAYVSTIDAAELKDILNNAVTKYHEKKALIDYFINLTDSSDHILLKDSDQSLQMSISKPEKKIKTLYSIETTIKISDISQIAQMIKEETGKASLDDEYINIPDKTYKLNNKNYSLFELKYYPKSKQLHFKLIFTPYFGNDNQKHQDLPKIFHKYIPLINLKTLAAESIKYPQIEIENWPLKLNIGKDKFKSPSAIFLKFEPQKSPQIYFSLNYDKAQEKIYENVKQVIQKYDGVQKIGNNHYALPNEKVIIACENFIVDNEPALQLSIYDIKYMSELKKQTQQKSTTSKEKPTVVETKKSE